MAQVTSIHPADLRTIENNLGAIHSDLERIDSRVDMVDDRVGKVRDDIRSLMSDFRDYVQRQTLENNKQVAHTELVRVRQELEKKYGHYDLVRRMTTGILQADDLGVVRKDTINTATEETMISTPGYWLAPCLVALSAWISDQKDLAEKALREGIKRDDEKTSLFFALVCRRVGRKAAALKWTQRYLAGQDEENLDRNAVIVLDAFASGLLGTDSENAVTQQIDTWIGRLSDTPGFTERQTKQWSQAMSLQRKPLEGNPYPYLERFSKTWHTMDDVMQGAILNGTLYEYFTGIFAQEVSTTTIKQQLDNVLDSLVTDFDDEELPLRKEEMLNQLIIEHGGDTHRAQQDMAIEQTALEEKKDFTQLLTDAAMKPESSHASVSTQKFAIALSRDWIRDAYNDLVAQNRMKVPGRVQIEIDTFEGFTANGENEAQLVGDFERLVAEERTRALAQCVLSSFDNFCLYGGGTIAAIGALMMVTGNALLGVVAIIAGLALVMRYTSTKKSVEARRAEVEEKYNKKLDDGRDILRASLAEVVDFRADFAARDAESAKVLDLLNQITPDQYVRRLDLSSRRINISK